MCGAVGVTTGHGRRQVRAPGGDRQPDAPPYSWQDPKDPKHLVGANVDLLRQVAEELGVKVEVLSAGRRDQALEEVRSGAWTCCSTPPCRWSN